MKVKANVKTNSAFIIEEKGKEPKVIQGKK